MEGSPLVNTKNFGRICDTAGYRCLRSSNNRRMWAESQKFPMPLGLIEPAMRCNRCHEVAVGRANTHRVCRDNRLAQHPQMLIMCNSAWRARDAVKRSDLNAHERNTNYFLQLQRGCRMCKQAHKVHRLKSCNWCWQGDVSSETCAAQNVTKKERANAKNQHN